MAPTPTRKSQRLVKVRKDPEFVYDQEFTSILNEGEVSRPSNSFWQINNVNTDVISERETPAQRSVFNCSLPLDSVSTNFSNEYSVEEVVRQQRSRSQSHTEHSDFSVSADDTVIFVNKNTSDIGGVKRKSSTRYDILDFHNFDNLILSCSSAVHTDTSEMGNSDSERAHSSRKHDFEDVLGGATSGVSKGIMEGGTFTTEALIEAVLNIDKLANRFVKLEEKIDKLEKSASEYSGSESIKSKKSKAKSKSKINVKKHDESSSDGSVNESILSKKCKSKSKSKSKISSDVIISDIESVNLSKSKSRKMVKKHRVDSEKDRTHKLVKDKLSHRKVSDCSSDQGEVSDSGTDMKKIKKRMPKKQRDKCGRKLADRLGEAGAIFPDDDFSPSSCSGEESDSNCKNSCGHSKKIKSGEKIRKRPVVRQELWPHTIANEEDGEETTSENISLAKILHVLHQLCFKQVVMQLEVGQFC